MIKMLKRREECDTYLTHVHRHPLSRKKPSEKIKYKIELSANTVAFISCRSRREPSEKIKYKIVLSASTVVLLKTIPIFTY